MLEHCTLLKKGKLLVLVMDCQSYIFLSSSDDLEPSFSDSGNSRDGDNDDGSTSFSDSESSDDDHQRYIM